MDISAPIKPAALHILIALADGDCHGYGILQAVRERSAGRVPLGTGSLYRHLARLIDAGWVAEVSSRRSDSDPRRGTQYRLTSHGRQVLAAEKQRLTELVAAMDGLRLSRKSST